MDAVGPVAEQSQDGSRAGIPAPPGERRIAVHVHGIHLGSGRDEDLDGLFVAEGGGAVEGSFALGTAIAHEAPGLDAGLGGYMGVGTVSEQDAHHEIAAEPIGGAEGGVQGDLSGVGQRMVGVSAVFHEELGEAPMAVKAGSVEVKVFAEPG